MIGELEFLNFMMEEKLTEFSWDSSHMGEN